MHQLQGILVRVFFAIDGHPDHRQTQLFKGKRAASDVSTEGIVVQQTHHHAHRHAIGEELILVKIRHAIRHGKRADLGGMQGVHGRRSTAGSSDLSVQRGCHGHLAQIQGELDVTVCQSFGFDGISIAFRWTYHEEGGVIEIHLDAHFLHGH